MQAIQSDAQSSTDAVKNISVIIEEISEYQTSIAAAVEEQNVATSEISVNLTTAASGTASISESISRVARAADDTTVQAGTAQSTATNLSGFAAELNELVSKFEV